MRAAMFSARKLPRGTLLECARGKTPTCSTSSGSNSIFHHCGLQEASTTWVSSVEEQDAADLVLAGVGQVGMFHERREAVAVRVIPYGKARREESPR